MGDCSKSYKLLRDARNVLLTVCPELLFQGLWMHQTVKGRLRPIERDHALSRMDEMSLSGILEGELET